MRRLSLQISKNKDYYRKVAITTALIFISVFVYSQITKRINLSTEVWVGIITSVVTAVYQYGIEKNKERIQERDSIREDANNEINRKLSTLAESIKKLESRIDSTILELQQGEEKIFENDAEIKNLERKIEANQEKLLKDRFDLFQTFFKEILDIKTNISRLEGVKETPISADAVTQLIDAILKRID